MKKLYALLITVIISSFAIAQTSGGPDAFGYTWKNSDDPVNPPSFQWYDISTVGTLVTGLGDDNYVGSFPIPGGFTYYYYTVNSFYIGSNGYLSFNGDNISSPFPAFIPLATGAQNFLAMNLSDLNFTGAGNPGKCYYHVKGDSIVVSFHDVPYWSVTAPSYTGSNTFQVILNKADSSITYNFLDMNLGTVTALDNAVGIENNNGTIGLQTMIDTSPADSLTVVYTYPPVVTYSVIDAGMNWNDNEANGGIFIKRRGDSLDLRTNVKNFGNTALGSVTVDNQVLNAVGGPQTSGNTSISSLAVGKDTTLNFTNKFYANAAGIYTFRTDVTTSGDAVNTNDVLDQKIIAIDTTKNLMTLDYSDGLPDGTGLGWNGGGGGIAIYIEPPMYPVKIKSSRFYISANTSAGFHAMIYDDDGPGGGPGTLLDSAYRGSFAVTVNGYNTVPTTNNNILISSGGVYLLWLMDGAGINLGRDITTPISRRTYEVLGGSWSTYRDFKTEDFLLGLNVASVVPKANFSADASMDPLVDFTDLSTNSPDTWKWTFGDGSPIDTTQNPSHTYATIDTFEVCLTVTNFAGIDSVCKDIQIKNIPPETDFAISTTNMPTIAFSDLSTNNPNKWHWDFGDGDTANTKNVTHRYLANDTFTVCLTAWNQAGPGDTVCKPVIISGLGIGIAENREEPFLNVYPNPSNGAAYIEFPYSEGGQKIQFVLIDMSGKRIDLQYQVVNNRISFDAGGLSNGTYVFEVFNSESKIGKGRFMVKK